MPSLRFGCAEQPHNREKAGDVLESVGGFLRPWNTCAGVVSRELGRQYGWGEHAVHDALRSLTNFVESASFAWAHASAKKSMFASFLSTHFGYDGAGGDFSGAGCYCIACAVRPSASISASGPRQSEASGPPGLCGQYGGGDAPEPTLAASFSASGPRRPWILGPPGLSGEDERSDASEPMADTAQHRVPPQVSDQRFSKQRSARSVKCDSCLEWFCGSGKGSFMQDTCKVKAGDRERLLAMGQLDGRWYCIERWAWFAGLPVRLMPDYLGWSQREEKREEYRQRQRRKPPDIGHSDQRFTVRSLAHRSVFCDFRGCLRRCQGVGAGYFVTKSLPPFEEREELWKHGILDMSFYCKDHYRQATGDLQPAWSSARCAKRQTHRNQTRH